MNVLLVLLVATLLLIGIRSILIRAPRYGKPFLIRVGIILLAIALFALAISGRLHWLVGLFSTVLPFLGRLLRWLLPLLRLAPLLGSAGQRRPQPQPSQGNRSQVTSHYLHMTLDHDSGNLDGQVLQGPFAGQSLADLDIPQLRELYALCLRHDPEGVRLLDAYIQRHRDSQWQGTGSTDSHTSAPMATDEALAILGLEPGASRYDIVQAHKRLMSRLHPDKGGSNYLAVKINQAKQALLQQSNS